MVRAGGPTVSAGRAVFAGCARNCAAHLPAALANIERLSALFDETFTVVVENDSTDATKAVLAQWGAGRPGYSGIHLDGLAGLEPARTRRLEFARNACLQAVLGEPRLAACDYLVVMDLDDAAARPLDLEAVRRALQFLREREQAAAVFANQRGVYYDLWALRHAQKCPGDLWEAVFDHARNNGVDDARAFAAAFQPRVFSLPTDAPALEVDSAFGGLGIYKLPWVARNPNPYLGYKLKLLRQPDGAVQVIRWQCCEHVHFHRGLRGLGGELFVLPWLVNRETFGMRFPPSAWRGLVF
jgi:glycosyltransferase involved in cell wall biosynthesis